MEGLNFRFYAGLAGVVVAGAIALLIAMLIFSRAVYAWGLFGAFLVISVVLLVFGWFYDRRQAQRYEAE